MENENIEIIMNCNTYILIEIKCSSDETVGGVSCAPLTGISFAFEEIFVDGIMKVR